MMKTPHTIIERNSISDINIHSEKLIKQNMMGGKDKLGEKANRQNGHKCKPLSKLA
uniref:Uncharacterized protein n=1 Tax=Arion vulgaris TaxID=1028688 RepID=A0A0B7BWU1_9EUPU